MKKILLLTDFSEAAQNALHVARSLFSDTVADFHLLCVYPLETDSFYSQQHVAQTAHTAFADQLHDIVVELRRQAVTDWHTFRATARPGQLLAVIGGILAGETYDFVVVGAKKDGTNELFGNTATALIRQVAANVLVVPVNAGPKPLQHIVLATDFATLRNCKLLSPLKSMVTLKGAMLTLLTVDTPGKTSVGLQQETRIRQFLQPIDPSIARLRAPNARQGIDTYLAGHPVDLLVTIPHHRGWTDTLNGASTTRSLAYTPPVLLLTLYDDGRTDQPQPVDNLSTIDCAL